MYFVLIIIMNDSIFCINTNSDAEGGPFNRKKPPGALAKSS